MKTGQDLRMRDFIAEDGRAIILDLTGGLSGVQFQSLEPVLQKLIQNSVDGLVLSPGEARRHYQMFVSKPASALLMRCDWSNLEWNEQFIYPRQKFRHVSIGSTAEALRIGASAAIIDVYYGISDEENAEDLQALRTLAEEGYDLGLPVIAHVIPFGPRITAQNFDDVVILGTRICLELGATAVSVPFLAESKLKMCIQSSINSPIFLNSHINPWNSHPIIPSEYLTVIKKYNLAGWFVDGFSPPMSPELLIKGIHE
jgi:DhnA family fructose-bisphosphate aldolase class Ia